MALVMSQMPDVWRKVLVEHVEDGTGRCRACRNADGETAAWPCQTFRVAQEAKWVAEGNLPGTGPHGSQGPSATPRLSPLDEPRRAPSSGYGDPDLSSHRGAGLGTGGWDLPGSHSAGSGTGGWDLPGSHGTGGWDLPTGDGHGLGTGGWDLPGSHGADHPSPAGWDLPGSTSSGDLDGGRSWDLGGPMPSDPHADDAATAFGGHGAYSPALMSLPPLPPTATPAPPAPAQHFAPSAPSWRDDPLGQGPLGAEPPGDDAWGRDPWPEESRHSAWHAEGWSAEAAPYGSRVDAPYGSTFGVDDRPRGSRH